MVRLDDVRLARARAGRLDHVRVDRALGEEADALELVRLFIEDLDEQAADDLALLLGVGDPGERSEVARRGVHTDHAHAEVLREGMHHLVTLVEPQQAVIDEHADELFADRPMQERRNHRGIDAARKSQQHAALPHLRPHARDRIVDDGADGPERLRAADVAHEAFEQTHALARVRNLGMELHTVIAARFVGHRGDRCVRARAHGAKSLRDRLDAIAVAHPHVEHGASFLIRAIGDAVEQATGRVGRHFGVAELAVLARRDTSAELLRHRLHAVADAEHRDAEFEDGARRRWCLRFGGGFGAA